MEVSIESNQIIKEIQVQKKDTSRVSLFSQNGFILGMSIQTWQVSGLQVGDVLTEERVQWISSQEERGKVEHYLIDLLSRRMHSSGELRQKAQKKGFPPDIVEDCILVFTEKKWLDDTLFCSAFIRDKSKLSGWGPLKIRQHLQRKGISTSLIEKALSEELPQKEQSGQLWPLLKKKQRTFLRELDENKRKQKVYRYLLGKGFGHGLIMSQLQSLMAKLTHDQL